MESVEVLLGSIGRRDSQSSNPLLTYFSQCWFSLTHSHPHLILYGDFWPPLENRLMVVDWSPKTHKPMMAKPPTTPIVATKSATVQPYQRNTQLQTPISPSIAAHTEIDQIHATAKPRPATKHPPTGQITATLQWHQRKETNKVKVRT